MSKKQALIVCAALVASMFGSAAADSLTSAFYITNGLVANWDAADNAGVGVHDGKATVWKDLAGSRDITLNANGYYTWTATSFTFTGSSGNGGECADSCTDYKTLEVAVQPPTDGYAFSFSGGSKNRGLIFKKQGGYWGIADRSGWFYDISGRDATYAIEYDDDDNPYFYDDCTNTVDNTHVYEGGFNEQDGKPITIAGMWHGNYGCAGKNMPFHTVRLYSRRLEERELRYNAAIDQVRFYGATIADAVGSLDWVPEDSGWNPEKKTFEVNTRFSSSIGTFGTSSDTNVLAGVGETVTMTFTKTAQVPDFRWNGLPADATYSADKRTVTFTASGPLEVTVTEVWDFSLKASCYITDDLIAMWDAKENAGEDVHDSAPTVWKDLAGTRDLTLNLNAIVSWGDAGVTVRKNGNYVGVCDETCTDYRTVELASDPDDDTMTGQGAIYAFNGGDNDHGIALSRRGMRSYSGTVSEPFYAISLQDSTLAVTYDEDTTPHCYENAAETTTESGSDYFGNVYAKLMLGGYGGGYAYVGVIHGARLYSDQLSVEELAYNAAVDAVRFRGADRVTAFADVTVFPAQVRKNGKTGDLEVQAYLAGDEYSQVRVNGSAPVAATNAWLAVGTRVTLEYVSSAGFGCKAWNGVPQDCFPIYGAQTNTVTFSVRGPVEVVAKSRIPDVRSCTVSDVGATQCAVAWELDTLGAETVHLVLRYGTDAEHLQEKDLGQVGASGSCVVRGLADDAAQTLVAVIVISPTLEVAGEEQAFHTLPAFRVSPTGTDAGDGRSWATAMTFTNALAHAETSSVPVEIWIAGTCVAAIEPRVYALPVATTIRGGFAGTEATAEERAASGWSMLDGNHTNDTCLIDNAAKVTIERLAFSRAYTHGLAKSGAGDLVVDGCLFLTNGIATTNRENGKAVRIFEADGATVTFRDCVFRGNRLERSGEYHMGSCAAFESGRRIVLDGCEFYGNSQRLRVADYYRNSANWESSWVRGGAIMAEVPVTVTGTRFVGNGVGMWNTDKESGGIVWLGGGAKGSVFTNCLWAANQCNCTWSEPKVEPDVDCSGALSVLLDDAEGRVDVVNCTFAANLSDGTHCAAVNVAAGDVRIVNSIFNGNVSGPKRAVLEGRDIHVKSNAACTVAYTLFDGTSTNGCLSALEGGVVNVGEGLVFGDAQLAGDVAAITNLITYGGGDVRDTCCAYFATNEANYAILENFNAHLRGGAGYRDESTGVLRRLPGRSPAIDAGDPADCSIEPEIDRVGNGGGRVNLGFYGNTPYATMTRLKGAAVILR